MVTLDHEPVPLTESSNVLELIFQFVHPRKQPGLDDTDFPLFLAVAEAAEKYEVYSAMNICQLRMKEYLPAQAPEIFGFAGKHNYPHLVAAASPVLIGKPLADVAHVLATHLFVPWSIYQQRWSICLNRSLCPPITTECDYYGDRAEWQRTVAKIQQHLNQNMARLLDIETIFETLLSEKQLKGCGSCQTSFRKWKKNIQKEVAMVPNFLTFWRQYRANEV